MSLKMILPEEYPHRPLKPGDLVVGNDPWPGEHCGRVVKTTYSELLYEVDPVRYHWAYSYTTVEWCGGGRQTGFTYYYHLHNEPAQPVTEEEPVTVPAKKSWRFWK